MYLRRAAALMELALCNWALQKIAARGFLPMTTPDLVRESILEKCGFQPRAEGTQVRDFLQLKEQAACQMAWERRLISFMTDGAVSSASFGQEGTCVMWLFAGICA